MTNFGSKIEQVQRQFPSIVKAALLQAPFLIAAYIGDEMERSPGQGNAVPFAPSSASKLQLGKGNLFRSYLPRDQNNVTNITGTSVVFGSKLAYAGIHETGGVIHAKKKITKGKKEVYAMAKYFWYKYKTTGSPYFRALALKVQRDGFITIKQRAYLAPAMKEFEQEGFTELGKYILNPIEAIFNA